MSLHLGYLLWSKPCIADLQGCARRSPSTAPYLLLAPLHCQISPRRRRMRPWCCFEEDNDNNQRCKDNNYGARCGRCFDREIQCSPCEKELLEPRKTSPIVLVVVLCRSFNWWKIGFLSNYKIRGLWFYFAEPPITPVMVTSSVIIIIGGTTKMKFDWLA